MLNEVHTYLAIEFLLVTVYYYDQYFYAVASISKKISYIGSILIIARKAYYSTNYLRRIIHDITTLYCCQPKIGPVIRRWYNMKNHQSNFFACYITFRSFITKPTQMCRSYYAVPNKFIANLFFISLIFCL